MYTEEKPRRGGLLKEFVMRLILIIIFVLLLLWIIPWSKMDVNPLKDQIFNANIQTMKEAGISYFTTERLPKEVGDKVTLTLQKMLDLKLVLPFTDRNGKSCDVKKSYITLEKQETEYLMKVNLKCGEEEDYILVHLGCYSYCTSAICEAKKGVTEKTSVKPTPTHYIPTPTATAPVPTPTPTHPVPTPTPTEVPTRLYEYKKTVKTTEAAVYSGWSNWVRYIKKANDGVVFGKTDLKEVEDLGYIKTKIGTKAAVTETIKVVTTEPVVIGQKTVKVCTGYKYFADMKSTYRIVTDWVTVPGSQSRGTSVPADYISGNSQVHYAVTGIDFNICGSDCTNNPVYIYEKQTRNIEVINDLSNVTAQCTSTEDRTVSIYINERVSKLQTIVKQPAQDVYANVRYYRVRTRELLKEGSEKITTSIKWSTYNDTTLLSNGYLYTGNYK